MVSYATKTAYDYWQRAYTRARRKKASGMAVMNTQEIQALCDELDRREQIINSLLAELYPIRIPENG